MDVKTILEQLSMSENEAKVYHALLRLGESTAVKIAQEAHLHRRTVYDTLTQLMRRGLASMAIKKYVRYYSPTNPEMLIRQIEERRQLLESVLPQLRTLYGEQKAKCQYNLLLGIEGGKTILADMVNEGKPVYIIGGGLVILDQLKYSKKTILEQFRKLKTAMIQVHRPNIKEYLKEFPNTKIRLIPKRYLSPVALISYSDRAVLLLVEEELVFMHIIGKSYAKAFKNYFDLIWQQAKPSD